jgi:hypothetical protein
VLDDLRPDRLLAAGTGAALLSGLPSTVHAVCVGADPLAASLAAGTLLLPGELRKDRLLVAAAVTHVALSLGWAALLAAGLPRRRPVLAGAVGGLGIAALDLGLVGRRRPRVRALPLAPQVADHVAYGAIVAAILVRRR